MKIGIVATHGVIPQVRYGFQDQVASELCRALNKNKKTPEWTQSVVLPKNGTANSADVPTISRIHLTSEPEPADPKHDFFDVHEAFWSPIDKGKTNFALVTSWLLKTIFLPFNDFARYMERPAKVAWDMSYIGLAIALAFASLLLAAFLTADAMRDILGMACPKPMPISTIKCWHPHFDISGFFLRIFHRDFWWNGLWNISHRDLWQREFANLFSMLSFVMNPLTFVKSLGPSTIVGIVLGIVGSFLGVQLVRGICFLASQLRELPKRDPIQFGSRIIANAILAALAFACLFGEWHTQINQSGSLLSEVGLFFIGAAATFTLGRTLLTSFVTNFFGDVQIYTTRNENSEFYHLREEILKKVTDTIVNVAANAPAGVPYDRVYVLAHSLGATISMDALMRLYNVQNASPNSAQPVLKATDWQRIRGFATFGSALEKTKYFFDAWNPTQSQNYEQWNAAAYGTLFTAQFDVLHTQNGVCNGIFWLNCWYFTDFVADRICSYRSFLLPGEPVSQTGNAIAEVKKNQSKNGGAYEARLLALNRGKFGPIWHVQTHTHYLEYDWFWHAQRTDDIGVLDVLTAAGRDVNPTTKFAQPIRALSTDTPTSPPRAEAVSGLRAFGLRPWDVVR